MMHLGRNCLGVGILIRTPLVEGGGGRGGGFGLAARSSGVLWRLRLNRRRLGRIGLSVILPGIRWRCPLRRRRLRRCWSLLLLMMTMGGRVCCMRVVGRLGRWMLAVMIDLGRRVRRMRRRARPDCPHWRRLRRLRAIVVLHMLGVRILITILTVNVASMLCRHDEAEEGRRWIVLPQRDVL